MMNDQIKGVWKLFIVGNDSVLEIRALWPNGTGHSKRPVIKHFRVSEFESTDACKREFESEALRLNSLGYNIYSPLNPINEDFTGSTATDSDIRCYNLLLIDIDRMGNTSDPATTEELSAAKQLAATIEQYLGEAGWPSPIKVMSGNGYHLYYPLDDVENSKESSALIRKTLHNLADRFDNDMVGVDQSVFNPSRITKVSGTIMRKGEESEDRPYREAVLCE